MFSHELEHKRAINKWELAIIITFVISIIVGCGSQNKDQLRAANDNNTANAVEAVVVQKDSTRQKSGMTDGEPQIRVFTTGMRIVGETQVSENSAATGPVNHKEQLTTMPGKSIFYFDSGDYQVNAGDYDNLHKHALFLANSHDSSFLTISGHADSRGSAEQNLALSHKRARQVYDILVSLGAPKDKLILDVYGESLPLKEQNHLAENRRVELQYGESITLSKAN